MAAGTVSPEQADVIVTSIDALPSGTAVRTRGEQAMVEHAGHFDATDLARTGRHLLAVIDPDGVDRTLEAQLEREDRAAHAGRYLAIVEDRVGGVRLKGRGSVEDGPLIKAALLPLTCPAPAVDEPDAHGPAHDRRDGGTRFWDALVQTCHHALDTETVPDSHGAPARLLITLTHESLLDGMAQSQTTGTAGLTGLTGDGCELPPRSPAPAGL